MVLVRSVPHVTTTEACDRLGIQYPTFRRLLNESGVRRVKSGHNPSARYVRESDLHVLAEMLEVERMRYDVEGQERPELSAAPSSSNVRAFPNTQTADVNTLVAALHVEVDRINWTEDRVRSFMAIISAMRSYDVLELYRTQTG